MVLDLRRASTDRLRTAWEEDLGLSLPEDTWTSILKLVYSTSLCARHSLIQFKVVHRAHITKAKLSSMYPDISPHYIKCGFALSWVLAIRLEPTPLIALLRLVETEVELSTENCCTLPSVSLLAR